MENKIKIIAIIQARSDSKRLPKKVLKKALNKPMIIHQLQRIKQSKYITQIILATSNKKSDNKLTKIVQNNGYKVFRGNKNNVLKRFFDCSKELNLNKKDIIIRLTGDCPLHDSGIIDETIKEFLKQDIDYISNCTNPIYPDGFDTEVFNTKSLHLAYKNATKKYQKEHVTPYIKETKKLKTANINNPPNHPEYRLTLDRKEDFKLIKYIFNYFNSTYFSFKEIIKFLEKNPNLLSINSHIKRNENYKKNDTN